MRVATAPTARLGSQAPHPSSTALQPHRPTLLLRYSPTALLPYTLSPGWLGSQAPPPPTPPALTPPPTPPQPPSLAPPLAPLPRACRSPSACGYCPYCPATCGCRHRRRPCCPTTYCPTALLPYCPTCPVAGAAAGPAPPRVPNPNPDPNPHPHPHPHPHPDQAPPQALLLLEYLPGGDLGLLLERQGPLGPQATLP